MATTIASIVSSANVLPGQDHRSSWADAEFRVISNGASFTLNVSGGASGLTFDLMQDVSGGHDPVVASGVKNGSTVKLSTGRAYYIANPKNSDNQSFTVNFQTNV
ncbi:MAG TPA: hypothetical protein VLQ93_09370 [Myxococcaceae bacterium]|nr:hypothetical protein [Myxococcaceae bacterium]